jgi:hypothetical protein
MSRKRHLRCDGVPIGKADGLVQPSRAGLTIFAGEEIARPLPAPAGGRGAWPFFTSFASVPPGEIFDLHCKKSQASR